MSATVIERGNLKLVYEPGQSYVELEQDLTGNMTTEPKRVIGLSFDDIAWLIHTAGPAALAAGKTITPKETP